MTPQMTIPQWLSLPITVRLRLKALFNVPRSSGTEVLNQTVMSDGHTHKDLAHITVEKMQAFLGVKTTDFFDLLNEVVSKVSLELSQTTEQKMAAARKEKEELERQKNASIKALAEEAALIAAERDKKLDEGELDHAPQIAPVKQKRKYTRRANVESV